MDSFYGFKCKPLDHKNLFGLIVDKSILTSIAGFSIDIVIWHRSN
jgi:hypothetical protein